MASSPPNSANNNNSDRSRHERLLEMESVWDKWEADRKAKGDPFPIPTVSDHPLAPLRPQTPKSNANSRGVSPGSARRRRQHHSSDTSDLVDPNLAEEKEWDIKEVLDCKIEENGNKKQELQYLIAWIGINERTGKPWPASWCFKSDITADKKLPEFIAKHPWAGSLATARVHLAKNGLYHFIYTFYRLYTGFPDFIACYPIPYPILTLS